MKGDALHASRFTLIALSDVLSDLRDFLGISWPELESAIQRNDIKRLLGEQARKLSPEPPDRSHDLHSLGGFET
jgi:hypothetical protein